MDFRKFLDQIWDLVLKRVSKFVIPEFRDTLLAPKITKCGDLLYLVRLWLFSSPTKIEVMKVERLLLSSLPSYYANLFLPSRDHTPTIERICWKWKCESIYTVKSQVLMRVTNKKIWFLGAFVYEIDVIWPVTNYKHPSYSAYRHYINLASTTTWPVANRH